MPEAKEGAVRRADVIAVLKAVLPGLNLSILADGDGSLTIVKDQNPHVYLLPSLVARPMLQKLSKRYGVKIECFYHPAMCIEGTGTRQ